MDHRAFRILGLDTTFTEPEQNRDSEATGPSNSPPLRLVKFTAGLDSEHAAGESRVTVRLADLLPLLIDASQKNRAWIHDFGDDEVTVSQDLYEVAVAYRSMGRAA